MNIEIVNLVLGYYIRISIIVTFDFEALMVRYDMDTAGASHGYGKTRILHIKSELYGYDMTRCVAYFEAPEHRSFETVT